MSKQIFKKDPPLNVLKELLQNIAIKDGEKYMLNKYCFKKATLNNEIEPFINSMNDYYHLSKNHYLKKNHTLTSLITIIRQICKFYNIKMVSKIKYYNSIYETIYYIYI